MADHLAIEATGLTKTYGSTQVLDGVDLRVAPGSVFSLLGPNGAGKTTMVRILSTLLRPDGGRARVAGFDIVRDRHRVRRSISLTGQYAALDGLQTGAENLRMMARLSGLRGAAARRRADELLARFGLDDAGAPPGRDLLRRHAPPARPGRQPGRPPVGDLPRRADDRPGPAQPPGHVAGHQRAGRLRGDVFLTTQYLEEADQLAGRVAVLDGGRIVAEGTTAELKERVAGQRLDLTAGRAGGVRRGRRRLGDRAMPPRSVRADARRAHRRHAPRHVRALLDEIDPERAVVGAFAVHATTLDDVFLALTGHATGAGPGHDPDRRRISPRRP